MSKKDEVIGYAIIGMLIGFVILLVLSIIIGIVIMILTIGAFIGAMLILKEDKNEKKPIKSSIG